MIIDKNIEDEIFFELSALLLSLNRKTFDSFVSLKSFNNLTKHFTTQKIEHLDALYALQSDIINHFLKYQNKSNIQHLHDSLIYLQTEGLVDKVSLEKLISLFDPSVFSNENEIEINSKTINENFNAYKKAILMNIDELKSVVNHPSKLDNVVDYLNNQSFSIGITGVMNAGKSTMLNALMGKDILGTSVVPETANLSVIKYTKNPVAKVIFWNESEWQRIQNSAKTIEAMSTFVKETKKYFKDDLNTYVMRESRVDEIKIEDLSNYTSANASDKKSNLVKYVELGSPLNFLQDSIEIVDTPGLDDIVIQREEITKEYLAKCDVMLHLMNVSQSATQKDVEFIIDAVMYQNITKVLVVITRVDMVSDEDVAEVIAYTKQSIAAKLHEQNNDTKLDFILKSLHFIALSGKMALLHRTGHSNEALEAGYTLEKTGILDVEDYLKETLFGKKNARSTLIIQSAKNRLYKLLQIELEALKFEYSLLFKTQDEVAKDLDSLKIKKSQHLETFERLKYQISSYEEEVKTYLGSLQHFLDNELIKLQNIIKQRLLDETRYSLEKENKAPQKNRLTTIIESALKHGLVDIIRDYRYKFIQKSTKIFETMTLQYDDIKEVDEKTYSSFNPQGIFTDAFSQGFLTTNNDTLILRVSKVVKHASINKLTKIDSEISTIIKEEFIHIQTLVKNKSLTLSETLLEEFFISLKEPIDLFESNLNHNEELLKNHALFLKEDEASRNDKSIQLRERIKSIELVAKRCSL